MTLFVEHVDISMNNDPNPNPNSNPNIEKIVLYILTLNLI